MIVMDLESYPCLGLVCGNCKMHFGVLMLKKTEQRAVMSDFLREFEVFALCYDCEMKITKNKFEEYMK